MHQITFNSKHILYISFAVLTMMGLYPLIVFDSVNKDNPVNFLLYIVSFTLLCYALLSIKKNNINSYNIFLFGFFLALFLNTFNLSIKQFEKELKDLYIFLIGPFAVFIILYFFENLPIKKLHFKTYIKININTFYLIILCLYIFMKLYIGYSVGFRVFDYGDIAQIQSGNQFKLPGFAGLAASLQWMLVIFSLYVKRKYSVVAILSIVLFSGFFDVKRGDLVRIFIFFIIAWYFVTLKISNKISSKKVILIGMFLLVFIYIFSLYGEYRLLERGGYDGIIKDFLGTQIDSVAISWIYSYVALNFDVLKLYLEFPPTYELNHFFNFFTHDTERIAQGMEITISGFNAATFIQPYFLDFGYFYWIEVMIIFSVLGMMILLIKKINFMGLYIFILMLLFLMLFGDYFTHRTIFVTIILSLLIFPFLRLSNNKEITFG